MKRTERSRRQRSRGEIEMPPRRAVNEGLCFITPDWWCSTSVHREPFGGFRVSEVVVQSSSIVVVNVQSAETPFVPVLLKLSQAIPYGVILWVVK